MKSELNLGKSLLRTMTVALLIGTLIFSSCGTSRAFRGGAIGTVAGGVAGGLIGHKAGNTAVGILIGAAIGGTAGALIGNHMDKQAAELQNDLEGAVVQRVGEGILITFNEGMQFDVDSYSVPAQGTANLNDLAKVLNKYPDTDILVEGHTDDTGADDYNQTLSEKRASAVQRFLISKGVVATRLSAIGYGESQPLQDNSSEDGRSANRRVEVAIYANEKMQKMAEKGEL